LDAELEKNKGLEESVLSMVNEISSLKSNIYDLEEEKKKIAIDHQEEVGPVIESNFYLCQIFMGNKVTTWHDIHYQKKV